MYFQFLQTSSEFLKNSCNLDVTVSRLHLSAVQEYKICVYDTKLAELITSFTHRSAPSHTTDVHFIT
jgi:histone deacetylase complex regulatory component SIN3